VQVLGDLDVADAISVGIPQRRESMLTNGINELTQDRS
jgi:hypothetical protein